MASRKDFVQKSRKRSAASPSRPAAKPRTKPAPAPPKRKPWKLALFSLLALAGLVYILNQLISVTPQTQPVATQKHSDSTPQKPIAQKPQPAKTQTTTKAPTPKPQQKPAPAASADSNATPVVENSTPASEESVGNKYEFYELLRKNEVTPSKVEAYKSTPKDAKLDKRYVLQAGSFRSESDAEKMRAQLLLSGLPNVHTNKSDGQNGVWYRVRVGPFDNRSAMNKAHDKLARLNINAMTIRVE